MSEGLLIIPVALVFLLTIVYLVLIRSIPLICWLIPFGVGIVLGALSGADYVVEEYVRGDQCTGYILKEYTRSVSVRADTCSVSIQNSSVFYVSCGDDRCPNVYSRIIFAISDVKRLGRFTGNGKIVKAELGDKSLPRVYYFWILRQGSRFRNSYYSWLGTKLPRDQASLVSSMLFGDTELPASLIATMKEVGVLHIVAISGVNVTYLLALVSSVTGDILRKRRVLIEVLVLSVLFFVVGEAVSLIRAIIMSFWGIFTRRVGAMPTRWDFFCGLGILLLIDSNYLWDAGFLLVGGACVGIYLGGSTLGKYLKPGVIREFLQGGLVWLCVAPVQFLIFGKLTIAGLFLGFLVGPEVEMLTLLGYISCVIRVVPFAGGVVRLLLGVLSSLILLVINLFHGQS